MLDRIKEFIKQNPNAVQRLIKILLKGDENEKQKAAIVLSLLDSDYSKEVYKNLNPDEIKLLTFEIVNQSDVNELVKSDVAEEFYINCLGIKFLMEGGENYAKEILEKSFKITDAQNIIDKIAVMLDRKRP